ESENLTQANNADAGNGMTAHNATTLEAGAKAEASAHANLRPTDGNMTFSTGANAGAYVAVTETVSVDGHGVGVSAGGTAISAGSFSIGVAPTLGEQDGKYNLGFNASGAIGLGGAGLQVSVSLDQHMVDGAVVGPA